MNKRNYTPRVFNDLFVVLQTTIDFTLKYEYQQFTMKMTIKINCSSFSKCQIIVAFLMALSLSSKIQASKIDNNSNNLADTTYSIVEKMPEFIGGEKEIFTYLKQTIQYPAQAKKKNEQGRVVVRFVITETGKVDNVKIVRGISQSIDNEALRVVRLMPDWIPGEQNGEKVAVYYTLPILFKMTTEEDAWEVNEKTVILIDGIKMPENFNIKLLNTDKLTSASVLKPFPKEEKSRLIKLYGKQAENGVLLVTSNKDDMYYLLADTTEINTNIDCKEEISKPEFVGGKTQLLNYIADSIQYPFVAKQLKTEGKVIVQFLVEKSGKISDAKVITSLDYFLDKEALRVINSMPNWQPGVQCNEKFAIWVTMPVQFKLDIPIAEKTWERNDKTIILLDGERLPASFDLAWLNYSNIASYKVLEPGTNEINKKLVKEYGKDAVHGVILIEMVK